MINAIGPLFVLPFICIHSHSFVFIRVLLGGAFSFVGTVFGVLFPAIRKWPRQSVLSKYWGKQVTAEQLDEQQANEMAQMMERQETMRKLAAGPVSTAPPNSQHLATTPASPVATSSTLQEEAVSPAAVELSTSTPTTTAAPASAPADPTNQV